MPAQPQAAMHRARTRSPGCHGCESRTPSSQSKITPSSPCCQGRARSPSRRSSKSTKEGTITSTRCGETKRVPRIRAHRHHLMHADQGYLCQQVRELTARRQTLLACTRAWNSQVTRYTELASRQDFQMLQESNQPQPVLMRPPRVGTLAVRICWLQTAKPFIAVWAVRCQRTLTRSRPSFQLVLGQCRSLPWRSMAPAAQRLRRQQ
mmetsp:Transcript_2265/g.6466  ORF Transcript_2265/g.6466 Transcript_2265/m.6466 type:complete len:207 (-) Transcript_2265:807-1427(-)